MSCIKLRQKTNYVKINLYNHHNYNSAQNKYGGIVISNYTATTTGTIAFNYIKGLDPVLRVTVQYTVDNQNYEITEDVKNVRSGFLGGILPFGRKYSALIGDTSLGAEVSICYNPADPSDAYIKGNK